MAWTALIDVLIGNWRLDSKFLLICLLVVHVLSIDSGFVLSIDFDVPSVQFPKAGC